MNSQPTQLIKALRGLASFMISCIYWMKGQDYRIILIIFIFLPRDFQNLLQKYVVLSVSISTLKLNRTTVN